MDHLEDSVCPSFLRLWPFRGLFASRPLWKAFYLLRCVHDLTPKSAFSDYCVYSVHEGPIPEHFGMLKMGFQAFGDALVAYPAP